MTTNEMIRSEEAAMYLQHFTEAAMYQVTEYGLTVNESATLIIRAYRIAQAHDRQIVHDYHVAEAAASMERSA